MIDLKQKLLDNLDIPQATIYRRTKELIKDGLLMALNYDSIHGKSVPIYAPLFEDVKINLLKNNIKISVKVEENTLNKSNIYQVLT